MTNRLKNLLLASLACLSVHTAQADGLTFEKQTAKVDFAQQLAEYKGQEFTIWRSLGRYGAPVKVGKTKKMTFRDKTLQMMDTTSVYYHVTDEEGNIRAVFSHDIRLFGSQVYIFRPHDSPEMIQRCVEKIHDELWRQDFSAKRYALLFTPGDYVEAGLMKVPFYVHMAGLGRTPFDVKVSNVHTPPHLGGGNATCTFWRSMENLSVIGPETYEEDETFKWSVSQAAPLRRIYSERTVRHQWGKGWVSGGFSADCWFVAPVGSDHQQQWYTRNSILEKGRGEFKEMKYNYVFQGVQLGDGVDKATYTDNWDRGGNVTFLPTTPTVREKPFLFINEEKRYKVFVPALRSESAGISYTRDNMGAGRELDLETDFYIVRPGTSAATINLQLSQGKHILFQPGMYELEEPLHVSRPGTVVMGLGWTTLIPGQSNPTAAIEVEDVDDVTICSLLFDAHYSSHSLLTLKGSGQSHAGKPTLLADLFFRVGGFRPSPVHVDCALEILANDVIGDHFWIWRADHGVKGSVGWDVNTAPCGLNVKGNDVTVYALFNEHFQQYQTLWEGERGRCFFYQCETPYDAHTQDRYMSENGTRPGFAAYKVADGVQQHEAVGMGIYDVLGDTEIRIESSVEVPENPGVRLYHVCNNSLSNPGPRGIGYVINKSTPSTYNTWRDNRTYVNEFVGGKVK